MGRQICLSPSASFLDSWATDPVGLSAGPVPSSAPRKAAAWMVGVTWRWSFGVFAWDLKIKWRHFRIPFRELRLSRYAASSDTDAPYPGL